MPLWWWYLLLVIRVILLAYVLIIALHCVIHAFYKRSTLNRRNRLIYLLVVVSFLLTASHISNNIWANIAVVKGQAFNRSNCMVWRAIWVILYVICLAPVSFLLWYRQKFFYQLNMIKATSPPLLLKLSWYIVYPMAVMFIVFPIFFAILYSGLMDVMDYKVNDDGMCISGNSKWFSSVLMTIGLILIMALHATLLYLMTRPLRDNLTSQANAAGQIVDVPKKKRALERSCSTFRSIQEADRRLIKKLAVVTGVVVCSEIVCILTYVILKKAGVDILTQMIVFDLQTVISSLSNVLCWKHWREILFPNFWTFLCQARGSVCSASGSIDRGRSTSGRSIRMQVRGGSTRGMPPRPGLLGLHGSRHGSQHGSQQGSRHGSAISTVI